jgi:hypothetical protein
VARQRAAAQPRIPQGAAELAKAVVQAEREVVPEDKHDLGEAALTELLEGTKNKNTPIIVECVFADIDDIVAKVRFRDWQHTDESERTVKQALPRYRLHRVQELSEKAFWLHQAVPLNSSEESTTTRSRWRLPLDSAGAMSMRTG